MLTGKQRSYLKSLAHNKKALIQLGKDGISEGFLEQLNILVEQHELIKVNVLDNSSMNTEEAAIEVCKALDAEFVQAIGNKFTIYRQSRLDPMIEIPGADNSRVKKNKQKKEGNLKKAEPLTKKGGKKSRPLRGKKSKLKALIMDKLSPSKVSFAKKPAADKKTSGKYVGAVSTKTTKPSEESSGETTHVGKSTYGKSFKISTQTVKKSNAEYKEDNKSETKKPKTYSARKSTSRPFASKNKTSNSRGRNK